MTRDNILRGQRVVLARHPVGAPVAGDLRIEKFDLPRPRDSQLLLGAQWLSLDSYKGVAQLA
jgi:NADPH-dependent curcumin reductase CurA